ncbi:ATP-binding protein [Streptomyces sp. NPDC095613]|uniref:ATP-binding protein n=1 Tax=Streptomyces sp. NPDC095613 TaxID=3155540 RepID=UPI0033170D64
MHLPPGNPARRPVQNPRTTAALALGAALPSPLGHPAYSQTLPCAPESARRARLLVTAACTAWGLPGLADAAALVVSELIANSVQHSGSRLVRVLISLPEPERVRVAVMDTSRTPPAPRATDADTEGGRGLVVIEALADRWGTELLRRGKQVYVELCPEKDGGQ